MFCLPHSTGRDRRSVRSAHAPGRTLCCRWIGALLGCLAAVGTAGCQSPPGLRLTQRVSNTSAAGFFDSNGVAGSLDIADVGLDESQLTYELRAEIDLGQVVLIGDYRRLGNSGNGTLPSDFSVNGVLFDAGDAVRADTAIKFVRGQFLWKLLPDGQLGLDVGLGLAGVDTRFGLRDVSSGTEASADEIGLTPFLAGRAIYRVGDFELEAQAGYIEGSFDLTDLYYLDLEFAGRWRFAGDVDGFSAWAEFGYRETDLVVDFMNDPAQVDTDLGLSGPFAGLVIQF